jgi:hypothetical protein
MFTPAEPPVLGLPTTAHGSESAPGEPSAPARAARRKKALTSKSAEAKAAADALVAATMILRELAKGRKVALTGDKELYTLKAPELGGWSRSRCRAAHRRARETGLLNR